uniref:substrate-binding periplasmic protein n=1 Tax=Ningiella ruwaisensis TaxID=2364274 RepID=UPI001F500949|nr:transporter substrate-binding domain-containing protein [Ningiella ruwaisensis]
MKAYMYMILALSFALMSCSQEQRQTAPADTTDAPEISAQAPDPTQNQMDDGAKEELASSDQDTSCSFKLGFDIWSPYQYVDVDDQVRGLDVELINEVTQDMGCDIEYIQGTWVSLLQDLQDGEVDMLLGASKTESREEFAYFSEPYRTEEYAVYIRKDDEEVAELADIQALIDEGKRIGVVSDYFYGDQMSEMLDDPAYSDQFVFSIMGELNIARLLDMDIDAFVEDNFVGASMLRRKAMNDYIVVHGHQIETGDIYVMFSKASVDKARVETFNERLRDFKQTEDYQMMIDKYRK